MKGRRLAVRSRARRGALPPIVVVVIAIAGVVAAALAAYFIYSTTARGVRRVILTVVGQPTLYATDAGVELKVTFKNDGTAPVNLAGSTVYVEDVNKKAVEFTLSSCSATTLQPGESSSCSYTVDNKSLDDFPDGALATLTTTDGYQTSFAVAKP